MILIVLGSIEFLTSWMVLRNQYGRHNFMNIISQYGQHNVSNRIRPPTTHRDTPRINFVYIKTHKCASETLSAMFRRYGYLRNLSFVLPVDGRNNLGWPEPLDKGMFRPSKTGGYNILCEHTILTLPLMADIMPKGTAFVTSIRKPMEHLKSAFIYFHLRKMCGINSRRALPEYLRHLDEYDYVYKAKNNSRRWYGCIPAGLSVTRNSMAFDLGFPIGFANGTTDQTHNDTFIEEWISMLDGIFDMVLIVEYFHECLVLLRRTFGWSIEDIIYVRLNSARRNFPEEEPIHPELVHTYEAWSRIDYKLYDHFNRTLWRKIADEGDDFWGEVNFVESVIKKVNEFCPLRKFRPEYTLSFPATAWGASFSIGVNDCAIMASRLMPQIKRQYDMIRVRVKYRKRTGQGC